MGTDIYLCEIQKFEPHEIAVGEEFDLFEYGFFTIDDLAGSAEQRQGFRELFRPYIGFWKVPEHDFGQVVDLNKFQMTSVISGKAEFVLKTFERFIEQDKKDLVPPQAFRKVLLSDVPQRIRSVEGICFKEISYQRKGLTKHWSKAYFNKQTREFNRNLFYRAEDLRKFYYCSPLKLRDALPTCIEFPKKWKEGKTFVYISY